MNALLMHPGDNVALATTDLPVGQVVELGGHRVTLRQPIPAGHKFALQPIRACDRVVKYGQPIGRATQDIPAGAHVHVHNVESLRGRGDLVDGGRVAPGGNPFSGADVTNLLTQADPLPEPLPTTFMGYRRQDGRVGVRNHVLVLATVQCANAVVDRIGQALPEVVALSHAWGCSQIGADLEQTRRVLEEFAGHPNVGAVLLIGLGCETMPTQEMGEKLAAGGVLCRRLTIQEEGGNRATLARGQALALELLQEVAHARREPVSLSELVLGVECGGSDAF